mmetsp:Transcript_45842/g.127583  ORF Transcript_45842/g.127583 Transcript_45842/m.127583 type:complete len:187 (-) Transcript_45842:243-803(-)
MPLVKIFPRQALRVTASELHGPLCKIWKAPLDVLKVLMFPPVDQNAVPGEDVYVDLRAKAKPERTKEAVQEALEQMSDLFYRHGYAANIRVELYEASLQSAFFKAPDQKAWEALELAAKTNAQLEHIFSEIDANHDGLIDAPELKSALESRGLPLGDRGIDSVIAAVDEKSDSVISLDAFTKWSHE